MAGTNCETLLTTLDCMRPRDSRPSFVSLPQAIRQRIYIQAGLWVDNPINFNWRINEARYTSRPLKNYFKTTHSLLLVCRLTYTETSALVYSTNRFFIRYRDAGSLSPLANLTEASLASLTHLAVHLHTTCCESDGVAGVCCVAYDQGAVCTRQWHDKPLALSSSSNAALAEWQNVARYLRANITPYTLRLSFLCDVEDLSTGNLAVQPFRNFPPLAECNIRLNRLHNPLLQELAVKTAHEAKGLTYPPYNEGSAFRFLDLPPECRFRILEYTDLVTPLREVEWNPKDKFYLHYVGWRCGNGERYWEDNPPSSHYGCQFRNCWEIQPSGVGCFCKRYHTAYSSKCRCWTPPTPMFLVCRALRQDAQTIFFERNHFIIAPATGCIVPVESSPDHLEVLEFFEKAIPSTALRSLRSLEIVFPPFHNDYLLPHEPSYRQWLQAIDRICQLNLQLLSLAVIMADGSSCRCAGSTQYRGRMSEQDARKIFDMYSRTLKPLSKLRRNGLRAFFLTLASPYTWAADMLEASLITSMAPHLEAAFDAADEYRQKKKREILEFTKIMQQVVMGEDYDSSVIQGRAHGQSQWLEAQIVREESF